MSDEKAFYITWATVAGMVIAFLAVAAFLAKPVQAKPAAELPAHLNLAGSDWVVDKVLYPGDTMGALGFTRCDVHHIQISTGIDGEAERETVVHEILHAYVCGAGMDAFDINNTWYNSTQKNHQGIDNAAYAVSDAIHRNPSLAAYLAEGK